MSDGKDMEQPLVFGLDIGTRNVVGTVGYRTKISLSLLLSISCSMIREQC